MTLSLVHFLSFLGIVFVDFNNCTPGTHSMTYCFGNALTIIYQAQYDPRQNCSGLYACLFFPLPVHQIQFRTDFPYCLMYPTPTDRWHYIDIINVVYYSPVSGFNIMADQCIIHFDNSGLYFPPLYHFTKITDYWRSPDLRLQEAFCCMVNPRSTCPLRGSGLCKSIRTSSRDHLYIISTWIFSRMTLPPSTGSSVLY